MKRRNVPIFVPHLGCPQRCSFCDQYSIAGKQAPVTPRQVEEICREAAAYLGESRRQAQIAFFGGSFTAIPETQMLTLLKAASPYVGESGFAGIRVSTRPDAVDAQVLSLLASYGVAAVDLGAQSMCDRVLQANRRGHTAEEVRRAAALVREAGMELGVQMMTGLYGDDDGGAQYTAAQLIALKPDTVRIYPALVLEGTLLARLWRAGTYQPQTMEAAVALCAELLEQFEAAGVRIIKVGLHAGEELRSRVLAGPYHPAFRELCEGRVMLRRLWDQLERERPSPGPVSVRVRPADRSRMAGHGGVNFRALHQAGYGITIVEDPAAPPLRPALKPEH